jgi:hypothetical protein
MKRCTPFMLALLLCLVPVGALAKTYVEKSGDPYHQEKTTKKFTLKGDGKQKLRITLGCESNKSGTGTMRVYFYQRSPQGGWDQIDGLRIHINGSQDETSDTFSLPAGEVQLQARGRGRKRLMLACGSPSRR